MLLWNPPPIQDQNGRIRQYQITLIETDTGNQEQYTAAGSQRRHEIRSLHPYYTYECAIAAVTIGQGPFSASVEIQTYTASEFYDGHLKLLYIGYMTSA